MQDWVKREKRRKEDGVRGSREQEGKRQNRGRSSLIKDVVEMAKWRVEADQG